MLFRSWILPWVCSALLACEADPRAGALAEGGVDAASSGPRDADGQNDAVPSLPGDMRLLELDVGPGQPRDLGIVSPADVAVGPGPSDAESPTPDALAPHTDVEPLPSDAAVPPQDAQPTDTMPPADLEPVLDAALPDVALPDVALPDAALPDAAVPDLALPDAAVPDLALPDAAVRDLALPDAAVLDAAVPDAAVPDAELPPEPYRFVCPDPPVVAPGVPTFYACDCGPGADAQCVPGNDANDGRSPERPYRTYGAARNAFNALPAGGRVVFCRGGAFTSDSRNFFNPNCTEEAPCILRDYVAPWSGGDEARPSITSVENGFSFQNGGAARQDGHYVLQGMHVIGPGNGRGFGIFFYNDVDDATVCDFEAERFDVGVHVAGANLPAQDDANGASERVTIRNGYIHDCSLQGFLGGGPQMSIEGVHFRNNGFGRAVFNHNVYVSQYGGGMRIVGNLLEDSTLIDGACNGVSLVVHGALNGLLIEGNVIRETGPSAQTCWGIAVDAGYGEREAFRDIVVRGNYIENVGNIGIAMNSCERCVIENNVIVHTLATPQRAIAAPVEGRGANDAPSTGFIVRNNSIYHTVGGGTGVDVSVEGADTVVTNNVILKSGPGPLTCFRTDPARVAYLAFDHNVCGHTGDGPLSWTTTAASLDVWRTLGPFDARSLAVDPQYLDPDAFNLRPAPGSPLFGRGDPLNAPVLDFNRRLRGLTPTVGAYER